MKHQMMGCVQAWQVLTHADDGHGSGLGQTPSRRSGGTFVVSPLLATTSPRSRVCARSLSSSSRPLSRARPTALTCTDTQTVIPTYIIATVYTRVVVVAL